MKIGGAERVVETIVTNLDKDRYTFEVWCLSRGGVIADELRRRGTTVRIFNFSRYLNPLSIIFLARQIRLSGVSVVHTHCHSAGVLGRLAAFLSRVPKIFHHVHTTSTSNGCTATVKEKVLGYFTQKIICCSFAVRNFVANQGWVKPEKAVVIYNGVDVDRFESSPAKRRELRQKWGYDDRIQVVGVVGSLVPHKGHRCFLDAAKIIIKTYQNARFVILGDGPLRNFLFEQVKNFGLSHYVRFEGCVLDVSSYMSSFDVFVQPSIEREGLGLSAIEAMAAGLPVVASRLDGLCEVIEDGRTGYLVPPGDSQALANGINKILSNPVQARNMGNIGRELCSERFSISNMVQVLQNEYEQ